MKMKVLSNSNIIPFRSEMYKILKKCQIPNDSVCTFNLQLNICFLFKLELNTEKEGCMSYTAPEDEGCI